MNQPPDEKRYDRKAGEGKKRVERLAARRWLCQDGALPMEKELP
jgi:hypothetical protein